MAYTLKTTGIAAAATSVIAVDEDGTTIKDFKSATRTANMTVHAEVVRGTSTWKGASRNYFQTLIDGDFNFKGLTFASGHYIPFNNSSGQPGTGVFIAYAGAETGRGTGTILAGPTAEELLKRNTNKLAYGYGGGGQGTTTLPTDGTTKFSIGANFVYGGERSYAYGLESGSLATDGSGTDGGFGANNNVAQIGGNSGQGNAAGKVHVIVILPRPLTLTEQQSLHNDWFGTLFDTGGGGETINATVGNAVAAGSTAVISKNIQANVGDAVANGSTASISNGSTIACSVGNAVADGSTASVTTRIMTDPLINNTDTVMASTAVHWSWIPAGRIGSMNGITITDGTGTTDANGRLAPGIVRTAGILKVAKRNTDATDDEVFYQAWNS